MEMELRKDNPYNPQHGILGTIVDGDHLIDLQEDAYINQGGTPTKCWYEAHAESRTRKDDDGDPIAYKVRWEITDRETENEEDCCDWGVFEIEEL